MEICETDSSPSSPVSSFLTQNKLLWKPGASFQVSEPLLPSWILSSPPDWLKIQPPPSWIWKTIESIVLETIAYCLSRLLIGYGSYKRGIVVMAFTPSTSSNNSDTRCWNTLGTDFIPNGNLVKRYFPKGVLKVRVHMNVVPRSTMNTNNGTEN